MSRAHDIECVTAAPSTNPHYEISSAADAEPEDLLRLDIPALIIPGRDAAHATSAARSLEQCLPWGSILDSAHSAVSLIVVMR
jgi:hypothetical protein